MVQTAAVEMRKTCCVLTRAGKRGKGCGGSGEPQPVITGLVPTIPTAREAVLSRSGMAGTGPAMTIEAVIEPVRP